MWVNNWKPEWEGGWAFGLLPVRSVPNTAEMDGGQWRSRAWWWRIWQAWLHSLCLGQNQLPLQAIHQNVARSQIFLFFRERETILPHKKILDRTARVLLHTRVWSLEWWVARQLPHFRVWRKCRQCCGIQTIAFCQPTNIFTACALHLPIYAYWHHHFHCSGQLPFSQQIRVFFCFSLRKHSYGH